MFAETVFREVFETLPDLGFKIAGVATEGPEAEGPGWKRLEAGGLAGGGLEVGAEETEGGRTTGEELLRIVAS